MNADDGFLLEGRDCECDDNSRCANHDDEAEATYWHDQWLGERGTHVEPDGYDVGDPKHLDLLGVLA